MDEKKIFQVFLAGDFSETNTNDKFEIIMTVLESNNIPAGIESVQNANFENTKTDIEESDIVLLIIGEKYGKPYRSENLCIAELEYNHAVKIGKPVIPFICTNNKESRDEKLCNFISKVEKEGGKLPSYEWKDMPKLLTGITRLLTVEIKKSEEFRKTTGWIKGRLSLPPIHTYIFISGAQAVGKTTITKALFDKYDTDFKLGMDIIRSASQTLEHEKHTLDLSDEEFQKRRKEMFEPLIRVKNRLINMKSYKNFIIEGVDIDPKLCFEREGTFINNFGKKCVFINLYIDSKDKHKERFQKWELGIEYTKGYEAMAKYYDRAWEISEKQKEEVEEIIQKDKIAAKHLININNSGSIEDTVNKIYEFLSKGVD